MDIQIGKFRDYYELKFKPFLKPFFLGKITFILWLVSPLIISLCSHIIAHNLGDKDGIISGHTKFIIKDILFISLFLIPVLIYFKLKNLNIILSSIYFYISLPIAFAIRIWLASLGGNFDLESYNIVADLIIEGKQVYTNTWRYNYAPFWAYTLAGLKFLALKFNNSANVFHFLIVSVLFSAEIFIAFQLLKKYKNPFIAILFILNPIGMVITGFHSQFDVLAIAFGYSASLNLKENKFVKGSVLLGISLIVKHIMVFYAFFLIFDKTISFKNKCIILAIPIILFLSSFLPFLYQIDAIKENVFGYKFGFNGGIYSQILHLILPEQLVKTALFKWMPVFKDWMFIWFITMVFLGFLVQKYLKEYTFEMYLLIIVASSVSFSEQYLYIPVLALSVFYKKMGTWIYIFLASFYLIFVSYNNLEPQKWLEFIGIEIINDNWRYSYANIQFWLIIVIISLFMKAYKLNCTQVEKRIT